MGGYDSKVHVYATKRGSEASELKYHFSLEGHKNSIKDIAFSPDLTVEGSEHKSVYIASGS